MKRTATLLIALALLSTSCGSEGNMSETTGIKLMTEAELIANSKDIVDREKFGLSLLKSPDGQCWDLPVSNWDMTLLALQGDSKCTIHEFWPLLHTPSTEAVLILNELGWSVGLCHWNQGETCPASFEYRPDRLTLIIKDGKVATFRGGLADRHTKTPDDFGDWLTTDLERPMTECGGDWITPNGIVKKSCKVGAGYRHDFTPIMGLSLEEATVMANEAGWGVEHCDYDVNEGGCVRTMDYVPSRVYLSINDGVVTHTSVG